MTHKSKCCSHNKDDDDDSDVDNFGKEDNPLKETLKGAMKNVRGEVIKPVNLNQLKSKTDKYRPDFGQLVGNSKNKHFFEAIPEDDMCNQVYGITSGTHGTLNNIRSVVQDSRVQNKSHRNYKKDKDDDQTVRSSF